MWIISLTAVRITTGLSTEPSDSEILDVQVTIPKQIAYNTKNRRLETDGDFVCKQEFLFCKKLSSRMKGILVAKKQKNSYI